MLSNHKYVNKTSILPGHTYIMVNNTEYMYLGICNTISINDLDYTTNNSIQQALNNTTPKHTYIRITNKIRKFINTTSDFDVFIQKFVTSSTQEAKIYTSNKPRQFVTENTTYPTFTITNELKLYKYPNYNIWNDKKLHNYILAIKKGA